MFRPLHSRVTCNVPSLIFQICVQLFWDTKPVYSTVYRKQVYRTSVQKTGLQYKCTENWFTVQVYRKLVFRASVQKEQTTKQTLAFLEHLSEPKISEQLTRPFEVLVLNFNCLQHRRKGFNNKDMIFLEHNVSDNLTDQKL